MVSIIQNNMPMFANGPDIRYRLDKGTKQIHPSIKEMAGPFRRWHQDYPELSFLFAFAMSICLSTCLPGKHLAAASIQRDGC